MTNEATCSYCKQALPPDVSKCSGCGEWLDGRWRFSGIGKLCLALIAVDLVSLSALFLEWIPTMKSLLKDFGGELPSFTAIVTSTWWLPLWMFAVIGLAVASIFATKRVRHRDTLLVAGFALGLIAAVITWWGLHLPISDLAGVIGPE
jgi:hypothetical protein